MTNEAAVLAALEEYAAAYCSKDIDRQMAIFDDGDDISLIAMVPLCSEFDISRKTDH